jgi:hypothetical protein
VQYRDINQKFREHLLRNEDILWSGQPDPSVIFTPIDIFLIPFSLLWGGFAIFWESSVLLTIPEDAPNGINIIFPLFGLIFVIVGLYFIFGRFIYKRWKKRKTYYAVTDRRVLSLSEAFGRQFQESDIKLISDISKRVRSDGIGTLIFGGTQSSIFSGYQFYTNTGMDILPFYTTPLAFSDIHDADRVYKLIMDVKSRERKN